MSLLVSFSTGEVRVCTLNGLGLPPDLVRVVGAVDSTTHQVDRCCSLGAQSNVSAMGHLPLEHYG